MARKQYVAPYGWYWLTWQDGRGLTDTRTVRDWSLRSVPDGSTETGLRWEFVAFRSRLESFVVACYPSEGQAEQVWFVFKELLITGGDWSTFTFPPALTTDEEYTPADFLRWAESAGFDTFPASTIKTDASELAKKADENDPFAD